MATCPKCRKTFSDTLTTCPDDGSVLVPDALKSAQSDVRLKRGDTVGEYVIEAQIGSGTFGDVYRAIQPLIGKQCAIKILSRKYSADPHIVSRFIAEARAVNQIRHKHIIDIFSFGQLPDGRHYHIMELLNGATLDHYLKERGRLPVEEVLKILQMLARALDAAHAAGIAHRDLKPANVFLSHDEDGKPFPKLLDFGIAKLLSDDVPRHHQTATGAAVGTPDYMSPEQCQGPNVDHRTDIYAFGVMTYQLLTGRLPFVGANVVDVLVKQMTAIPEPPSKVHTALPEVLDRPILWMLEKDKDNRPPSLATAIRALEQAAISAGFAVMPSATTGDPGATPPLGIAGHLEIPVSVSASKTVADTMHSAPSSPAASVLSDTLPSAARSSQPPGASAIEAPKPKGTKRAALAVGTVAAIAAISALAFFSNPPADPEAQAKAQVPATSAADASAIAVEARPPDPVPVPVPVPTATTTATPAGDTEAATVELRVQSDPKTVEIYAPGGVLLGKSPCTVHLRRGTEIVKLEFRASGYIPLTKDITPLADGEVEVALKKKVTIKTIKKKPKSDDIEDAFN